MKTSDNVILNKYNFYELAKKPTIAELEEYYSKKYYQDNKGSYEINYSEEEILYFNYPIFLCDLIIEIKVA